MAFVATICTLLLLNLTIPTLGRVSVRHIIPRPSSVPQNDPFLKNSSEENSFQDLSTAAAIQESVVEPFSGDGTDGIKSDEDTQGTITEVDKKYPVIDENEPEWTDKTDDQNQYVKDDDQTQYVKDGSQDWSSDGDDHDWTSEEDGDRSWANEDDGQEWSTDDIIKNLTAEARIHELSSLSALFTITRHGARTPIYYAAEDPHNKFWVDGPGQLTNIGKNEMYFYGQQFRNQYNGFLNELYDPKEVTIRSSPKDRTIMSAQSFLAGLYPPTRHQLWNPNLKWQPIPVYLFTDDVEASVRNISKKSYSNCPSNKPLSSYERFSRYQAAISAIENATGVNGFVCNLYQVLKTADVFQVEDNFNLTLPFGLDTKREEVLELLNEVSFILFGTYEEASLLNEQLLSNILMKIESHVSNTTSQKAHFYFMHDVNIIGVLSLLANATLKSPFASSIVIELRKDAKSGGFVIKMFFRETPDAKPEIQTIKDCGTHCPLDDFIKIIRRTLVRPTYFSCLC